MILCRPLSRRLAPERGGNLNRNNWDYWTQRNRRHHRPKCQPGSKDASPTVTFCRMLTPATCSLERCTALQARQMYIYCIYNGSSNNNRYFHDVYLFTKTTKHGNYYYFFKPMLKPLWKRIFCFSSFFVVVFSLNDLKVRCSRHAVNSRGLVRQGKNESPPWSQGREPRQPVRAALSFSSSGGSSSSSIPATGLRAQRPRKQQRHWCLLWNHFPELEWKMRAFCFFFMKARPHKNPHR